LCFWFDTFVGCGGSRSKLFIKKTWYFMNSVFVEYKISRQDITISWENSLVIFPRKVNTWPVKKDLGGSARHHPGDGAHIHWVRNITGGNHWCIWSSYASNIYDLHLMPNAQGHLWISKAAFGACFVPPHRSTKHAPKLPFICQRELCDIYSTCQPYALMHMVFICIPFCPQYVLSNINTTVSS
jgi:hypothetical protein